MINALNLEVVTLLSERKKINTSAKSDVTVAKERDEGKPAGGVFDSVQQLTEMEQRSPRKMINALNLEAGILLSERKKINATSAQSSGVDERSTGATDFPEAGSALDLKDIKSFADGWWVDRDGHT